MHAQRDIWRLIRGNGAGDIFGVVPTVRQRYTGLEFFVPVVLEPIYLIDRKMLRKCSFYTGSV